MIACATPCDTHHRNTANSARLLWMRSQVSKNEDLFSFSVRDITKNRAKGPKSYAPETCKFTRRETNHQRFPHRDAPKERTWAPCHNTLSFPLGAADHGHIKSAALSYNPLRKAV